MTFLRAASVELAMSKLHSVHLARQWHRLRHRPRPQLFVAVVEIPLLLALVALRFPDLLDDGETLRSTEEPETELLDAGTPSSRSYKTAPGAQVCEDEMAECQHRGHPMSQSSIPSIVKVEGDGSNSDHDGEAKTTPATPVKASVEDASSSSHGSTRYD
ncbi:hypothetical protein BU16DRAFT_603033 [Lophium mytilinum]|uniref:Uncharacterized protein n=1 Tax=Lophium mytilinum TaxID=390894 RepID=A0A6A6R404_9PEZI|nr:hypothetical protein BU16DRAFT_603033 [Lophium mytilinum]